MKTVNFGTSEGNSAVKKWHYFDQFLLSHINIGKFEKAMIYYFTQVHVSTCIVLEEGNLSAAYEFINFAAHW